ncbi:riboflavin biosynthesis protein RibD [Dehalococcoides mccartyi]|uniref:bifunctional diaminohydroxyphosphoribosylaminopyrimidine deaminase/5-amino-6-(5-phosphoribosylamino)uracil reductase RibD n=1 Tax=Dehalococcoides mccartyi TaxID=61435 RepID=UPI0009902E9E|nr:bifunctional diaminohydroxyphosphoribosylaminopyrimidine deaminase/5-amino-6-(5-phosphoribosylamino)uracil reductase RibD [Dehalococcoides mccartyi]AQU03435.1 riboflavin biosynthesis protein RibD [Dehalococcoides mccartyi]AQU04734.1 riboflavin biosynthesis protein RibD [Dehalococcoides mccartyi]
MKYMSQALSLAKLAIGQVSPNPAVGAVIVKNGEVVGQGFTQPPGGDHAEIVALRQAAEKAKGAALYVTLEPCCHQGRTPPCTVAIIESGIKEVYIATLDDNPLVSGKGKKELEDAGIKVHLGMMEREARQMNEAYFKYITTGMPFVTAKYAMSLDGKTGTRTGDSKWISNEESRHFAHYIRHISDVIMAGLNTILKDDPHLTARVNCGRGGTSHCQPTRVIIDDNGRAPLSSNVFHVPGNTIVAVAKGLTPEEKQAYDEVGAKVVEMPDERGLVDLKSLLRYLGQNGVTSVLVEGGGIVLGSLFDLKLVDKVLVFVAPIIIGGKDAKIPVAGLGAELITDSAKLRDITTTAFGQDVLISGYVIKE